MLQLLLNNKPATLKTGTTFKLTRVNPYFDDQGDYTLEVQLPLQGCPQNLAIFGPLHRPEMAHTALIGQKLKMRLIAPPVTLDGYATITSITNTEVKVQLTAGKSTLLNAQGSDAQYIDELPLGQAWNAQELPTSPTLRFGSVNETDAVIFPLYSEEDDLVVNALADETTDPGIAFYIFKGYIKQPDGTFIQGQKRVTSNTLIAPQHYLLPTLRSIINALGYQQGDWSTIEKDPIRANLVILNTNTTLERAAALPHWTVKQFLNEVQNLLGILFTVEGNTVNVRPLPKYYDKSNTQITLTQVVDTQTTDLDHTATIESKVLGCATYKFTTDDPLLQLPAEVYEKATLINTEETDMYTHFNALTEEEKAQSNYLYIAHGANHVYAILHRADTPDIFQLTEVDQLAPSNTSPTSRADAIELNIVPAHTILANVVTWTGAVNKKEAVRTYTPTNDPTTAYPLLSIPTPVTDATVPYSVDAAINPTDGTDTTTDKPSTIYLAWYDGRIKAVGLYNGIARFPEPIAIPLYKDDTTGLYQDTLQPHGTRDPQTERPHIFPNNTPFTLKPEKVTVPDSYGCIGNFLTGATNIDTRVEHQIQFLDPITPDPTATYLIRGRRYACHKLELTLTPTGPAPLIQGYFYELQ